MKKIIDAISGKSKRERAFIVASAWASIGKRERFNAGRYDLEIVGIGKIEVGGNPGVEILARVWDENVQIGFGRDGTVDVERFRFLGGLPFMCKTGKFEEREVTVGGKRKKKQIPVTEENVGKKVVQHLIEAIGVKRQKFNSLNIIPGKVGSTTTIVYVTGATIDGQVGRGSSGGTWAQYRDGNGATNYSLISPYIYRDAGIWYAMDRGVAVFPTDAAIADSEVVSSATISFMPITAISNTFSISFAIDFYIPSSDSSRTNSDYQTAGDTRMADSDIAYASLSNGVYANWTLNAAGIAKVHVDDNSRFMLRVDKDLDDSDPGSNGPSGYTFENYTTHDDPPKLTIEHEPAPVDASRPAELTGAQDVNVARPAELTGIADTDAARPAEVTGIDTTDDARPAETTGAVVSNAARPVEVHGQAPGADARPAETHGVDTDNDARPAEATGAIVTNAARPAEIHGIDQASADRPAEVHGSAVATGDRPSELHGVDSEADARPSELTGAITSDDARPAELHGIGTTGGARPSEVHGIDTTGSARPSEVHGIDTEADSRPAEMHGTDQGDAARPAEATGIDSANSERPAEIDGIDGADDSRPAEIHGVDSTGEARPAEVAGIDGSEADRPAELHGVDTGQAIRPAETSGYSEADAARAAELHGTDGGEASRSCEIEGVGNEIGIDSSVITSAEASAVLTTKVNKS